MNVSRRIRLRRGLKRTAVALVLAVATLGMLRAVASLVLPAAGVDGVADIVLDPGHGGSDPGALGGGRAPLREKDATLDIARRTASLLRAEGLRVGLTREEDETVSLPERLARARRIGGADSVLVSIHCNHADERAAVGIETWHTSLAESGSFLARVQRWGMVLLGRDPSLDPSERAAESGRLAQCLQRAVSSHARRPDRGLRDGSLYLTRRASGPAVLVECGFISNPVEAALLASEAHRQRLAEGLAKGCREFRESVRR